MNKVIVLYKNVLIVLAILFSVVQPVMAQTSLHGVVVGVADGDTLTLLVDGSTQVKVRLSGIDSPEKRQAFGTKAKQTLTALCFGKAATVNVIQIDRYARSVGEVFCAGKYANEEMVRTGMAWVYRRYAKAGYDDLYSAEREARTFGRGLWADTMPVPPWEWRKVSSGL